MEMQYHSKYECNTKQTDVLPWSIAMVHSGNLILAWWMKCIKHKNESNIYDVANVDTDETSGSWISLR